MATGDQNDIQNRLISYLPPWFETTNPNVNGLLAAYAVTGAFVYRLLQYIKLQTRIKTATEDNLDQISIDYLGNKLPRRTNESDESYRNRILANLLPFPSTRQGISDAIYALTGRRPIIFEPWYANDTGFLNHNFYLNKTYLASGSDKYDATFFITVFRPIATGKDFPALNHNFYLNNNSYLWSKDLIGRQVTDDDIINLINAVRAAGVTALVEILD